MDPRWQRSMTALFWCTQVASGVGTTQIKLKKPLKKTSSFLQNTQIQLAKSFPIKQMTFADAEQTDKLKQTRREQFLIEMDQGDPWPGLIILIKPY